MYWKYGIGFAAVAKKTVREACAEKRIDATKVEQELQQIVQASSATGGWTTMNGTWIFWQIILWTHTIIMYANICPK